MAERGVGINLGISSSIPGFPAMWQSKDRESHSDREDIRDGSGNVVGIAFYNASSKLVMEGVLTGSGGVFNAPPPSVVIGSLVSVTDPGDATATGSNYIITDYSSKSGNTSAMRLNVTLEAYPGVTS